MSDIVADAKSWLAGRDNKTLRTHSDNCHQWHAECLVARLVAEIERHRMTPEERHSADLCSAVCCHYDASKVLFFYLDRTAQEGNP